MDIGIDEFWINLPLMLDCIAKSRFVAVDLEMGGISVKNMTSKPSFQEAYEYAKEAAQRFPIIQVGLTCVQYDESKRKLTASQVAVSLSADIQHEDEYSTISFSIHVSSFFPQQRGFQQRLMAKLDRTLSFTPDSFEFLCKHNVKIDDGVRSGVPYLSRHDEQEAKFQSDPNREEEFIDPMSLDCYAQQFYHNARIQIKNWLDDANSAKTDGYLVENPFGDRVNPLQLRLLRQLVRMEFPQCSVRQFGDDRQYARVSITTAQDEAQKKKYQASNEKEINFIVGVRYLFEALSGGNFASTINSNWPPNSLRPNACHLDEYRKNFDFVKCENGLRDSRPILVGHNLLCDMCFIYQAFFHPLPEKLEDFRTAIHELFPRIVDTKYVYSRDKHSMVPDQRLEELYNTYKTDELPAVHSDNDVYGVDGTNGAAHDAGFDSWMTAVVFLKQMHKLFLRGAHLATVGETVFSPSEPKSSENVAVEHAEDETGSCSTTEKDLYEQQDEAELRHLNSLQQFGCLQPRPFATATGHVSGLKETHSKYEVDIIPLWFHGFWRAFGNRTRMYGKGVLEFK